MAIVNLDYQDYVLGLVLTGTLYCVLADDYVYTHTTVASTDISGTDILITMVGSTPAPVVGTRFKFSTSGTLPSVVNGTSVYYVKSVSGSGGTRTITITSTPNTVGGAAIDFTGNVGTGTHTLTELAPVSVTTGEVPIFSVADLVRHEIPTYPDSGTAVRPTIAIGTLSRRNSDRDLFYPMTASLNNSAGGAINFRYAAFIFGGSATPGNTTGTLGNVFRFTTTQTVGAGGSAAVPFNEGYNGFA